MRPAPSVCYACHPHPRPHIALKPVPVSPTRPSYGFTLRRFTDISVRFCSVSTSAAMVKRCLIYTHSQVWLALSVLLQMGEFKHTSWNSLNLHPAQRPWRPRTSGDPRHSAQARAPHAGPQLIPHANMDVHLQRLKRTAYNTSFKRNELTNKRRIALPAHRQQGILKTQNIGVHVNSHLPHCELNLQ